jgi:hypothetical protein
LRTNNRFGVLLAVAGFLLAANGAVAIRDAFAFDRPPPQPPHTAADSARTPRTAPTPSTTEPTNVLAPSRPVELAIPAIGVKSAIIDLGLSPDGTIAVPNPGPDYNDAAWYIYSPTPGQVGPSIIEGHVDSAAEGPSVFYRLGELRPGERVQVSLVDGTVAIFEIDAVSSYPKTAFPTQAVYGNTSFPALRLITCGGPFDSATGHYLDNTVVFAHLAVARNTGAEN